MAAMLLVGCGDLGTALAARLVAAGHRITALKRSPPAQPVPGVDYRRADLTREAPDLAGATFDQAFVILSPGARDAAAYQALYVHGVARLAEAFAGRVGHWFFVSSTSVYGQQRGEWVDEDSPTEPAPATARCLLAAERRLAGSGAPATTIRFSGIYGPGHERLLRQIAAGTAVQYDPPTYTNRIHREDCIGTLELLHRRALEGRLLAALGRRATRGEGRVNSTGDVTDPFPQTRSRDVFGDDRDPACEQRDAKCSSLSIVASV